MWTRGAAEEETGAFNVESGEAHWVGTWGAPPQRVEADNYPPPPGLANNSLRQLVYVSIGGETLRLALSNEFGDGPLVIEAVQVARPIGHDAIDKNSSAVLSFSGSRTVIIPVGGVAYSDAFSFELQSQSVVAVTIRFGDVPLAITGHPGSRTTSYIARGDAVGAARSPTSVATDHWYFISRLEVLAPRTAAAVVMLGDSLTDGRGSTTNGNDRWPDALSRRLRANPTTKQVAVVNAGIGGNCVVSGGLGPTLRERFERDALGTAGVRWVIVLAGVNDVGEASDQSVVTSLRAAFEECIRKAHAVGVLVYGVPLLPFGGSQYDSPEGRLARHAINDWIRSSGAFDAVLDLGEAVADGANSAVLRTECDDGDGLHLTPFGYQLMADAVELGLFECTREPSNGR